MQETTPEAASTLANEQPGEPAQAEGQPRLLLEYLEAFESREFSESVAIYLFSALFFCYFLQFYGALDRASNPLEEPQEEQKDQKNDRTRITLLDVVRHHDGGQHNVWNFFVLVVFWPVVLTAMGNMIALTGPVEYERWPATIYHLCLATIGVLITLELSHVYHVRRSASEWIPMLIVAIGLDVLGLLILFGLVKNPSFWPNPQLGINTVDASQLLGEELRERLDMAVRHDGTLQGFTLVFMGSTTLLAIISSFTILVLARTAAALRDQPVNVEAVVSAVNRESSAEGHEPPENGAAPPEERRCGNILDLAVPTRTRRDRRRRLKSRLSERTATKPQHDSSTQHGERRG